MKEKRAAGTFQLTPSRRATDEAGYLVMLPGISTHALTEGDSTEFRPCPGQMHFNSRPHGGRLKPMLGSYSITNFNSRPHGGRLQI